MIRPAVAACLATTALWACSTQTDTSPATPTGSSSSATMPTVTVTSQPTTPTQSLTTASLQAYSPAVALSGAVWSDGAKAVPIVGGVELPPLADGALTGVRVGIDPGHNGGRDRVLTSQVPAGRGRTKACNTTGTASTAGVPEHTLMWEFALRTVYELRSRGAHVVLTRGSDEGVGPCVNERAGIPNRANVSAVVSFHADGNLAGSARGFHIIRSTDMLGGEPVTAESQALAERLVPGIEAAGMPRSTYIGSGTAISPRADIAGMNLLKVPGVLLELGNMRHPADLEVLQDKQFHARIATVVADSLAPYAKQANR